MVNVPAKLVKSKLPIFPSNATDSVADVVFRPNPVPAVATFTFGAYASAIVPKLIVFVIAKGLIDESLYTELIGGVMTLIGSIWSIASKKSA